MPGLSNSQIIVALFALAGVVLGVLASSVKDFFNRRAEDRRHLRELAIKTGFTYWERQLDMVKLQAQAAGKTLYAIPPDSFIIYMLLLAELLSTKRITEDNVVRELARIRSISDAVIDSTKP